MKVFFIFLNFLIYLGHGAGYHYPQNEETPNIHREMDTFKPPELSKIGKDIKSPELPLPTFSWPYVGDGCCNLSTTPKCFKEGGECIPRNDTCIGDVYLGSKYCDFNKLKSCQCCVPPNCETLNLCKVLNGTCNVACEGKSVSGKDFCKGSKHCKCCLPEEPQDCPCGQDYNGGCQGQFLPGKWATGHCEKNCSKGTYTLDNHTCNKTGGEDCMCCAMEPTTTTTTTSTTSTTTTTTTTSTTTPPTTLTYCDTQSTTICSDGSRCHDNATCIPNSQGYVCKCNIGYAGDGADCGLDQDIDTWPDLELACCKVEDHCKADNCPAKPNSGQEDIDCDSIGDACDLVLNTSYNCSSNNTVPSNSTNKCQDLFDASKTTDTDGDGHMDYFDNCPNVINVNQTDFDGDNVGDICDTDLDADNDGFQDGIDNCQSVVNPEQSDADKDGLGDRCDTDADNDGILNTKDNCWLVPNPDQEDTNSDGVGDVCEDDKDGDGCFDWDDICTHNTKVNSVNFGDFKSVAFEPNKTWDGTHGQAVWNLTDGGKEITQEINSWAALMYGLHSFSGVDYDGTLFITKNWDDDYAGFIFGYQSNKKFYVVAWSKSRGMQLKRVHSITGPGSSLAVALWLVGNTTNQVTLLWKDPIQAPWDYDTSYRWQLIHRPHIGLIRFRFLTGSTIIGDSGNIYDEEIQGGRIGVYCNSQQQITWSDLDYSCNDDSVPQEVYDDLPADKKSNITVNPFKSWSGKPQIGNKTLTP